MVFLLLGELVLGVAGHCVESLFDPIKHCSAVPGDIVFCERGDTQSQYNVSFLVELISRYIVSRRC